MSTSAVKRYSIDEYMAMERASETKHQYYDGESFAMVGASSPHNLVAGNLARELGNLLRERPCLVYPSDMRVVCPTGLGTYPDVSVVCDHPVFEDGHNDALLNPLVLIEVLSPSTEAFDRGKKFEHYESIPSLREYLLVAQDRVSIAQYSRKDLNESWSLTMITDLSSDLNSTALKVSCRSPVSMPK